MQHHLDNVHLFITQLHVLQGQFKRLEECFTHESTNAQKLHIIQTVKGSSINLLELFEACLRDSVIMLTDTPPGTKIICCETASKIDMIRNAALTIRVSWLPPVIAFLEELKKNSPSESIK